MVKRNMLIHNDWAHGLVLWHHGAQWLCTLQSNQHSWPTTTCAELEGDRVGREGYSLWGVWWMCGLHKMITVHVKGPCSSLRISPDEPDLVPASRHPWVLVGGDHVHVAVDAVHLPKTLPQLLDLMADSLFSGGAVKHPDQHTHSPGNKHSYWLIPHYCCGAWQRTSHK